MIKAYRQNKMNKTSLKVNKAKEGETIEMKVNRIVNNKEPITDGAPLNYTDRKDGVLPQYNIRFDKWELGAEKMEVVHDVFQSQREERHKPEPKNDGGAESTQATT